jgi:hypothetical protein
MINLSDIMTTIIKDSFPELINTIIEIQYKKIKSCHLLTCEQIKKNVFHINVDPLLSGLHLTGGIAHELCHIVRTKTLSESQQTKDFQLYQSNKLYRQLDERYTDFDTISRGYGFELYLLMKNYFKYKKTSKNAFVGMTAEEIKEILDRNG